VKIAKNSPATVAIEVVRCLVTLVDVSDEEFLAHDSVCVSISELAGSFHGGLDDEYREALMELLFNVAATTRVQRVLLNLWFNLEVMRNRDVQSASDVSSDVSLHYGFSNIRTTFLSSMLCWIMSLLKEGSGISPRQGCYILLSWQEMETNWKNGYFQVIWRR
jgi:hypothetical protein